MEFKLSNLLGIKYPIFQGAMAYIANAELASAVSNAGGLGIIAAGDKPAEFLKIEIEKYKTLSNKPFAVNLMLLSNHLDEIVELIIEEDVKIVTTGAGSPAKYMQKFKENNIKVIPVVASVALAKMMGKIGADALIVEGMEAGGHIGKTTTMSLVPQVVDAVNIPVIAAGGIADARGMLASFALGASGIQMGTRFILANESIAHENYKNAIIKANDISTAIISEINKHPIRVLRTKFSKNIEKIEKSITISDNQDLSELSELKKDSLMKAVYDGNLDEGSFMAGQISGLLNKKESAEDIISEIMTGFYELIENFKI